MSLWDHIPPGDMSKILIEWSVRGNYGLAGKKWTQQLDEIRRLPEAKKP